MAELAKSPKTAKAAKLCREYADWSIADCEAIAGRKIHIGMTSEQVKAAWGKPKSVNGTTSSRGTQEQWVYACNYAYFDEDGKLYSMQGQTVGC